ncbi:telomeric repeat-binding factor 1 isoform X1 [Etheostoma spectabile]|uniref:telomeric repeat-binding factor 1 isoform X1 n=1 Tax=Etheostoma spectabile TaxID=54343 RepID=UPI0013AFBFB2|nr:telomeric repeat-binding factor 1 isoform X1 [Etheostoma spectabile]
MEPEINNETPTVASYIDGNVRFSHVSAVATGWMFDFMFVSLCRRFKEGKFDEFNEALLTFQAISKSPSLNRDLHNEKTMICAFLVRVMHGKQLNVLFEEDDHVMPLMSATKIWSNLEHTVADESLFTTITILLLVQSVAVCLEKGKRSSASSVLKWFENNKEFPQKVRVKLLTIVTRRETYHPFLMSFSFSRLLDTIQTYLDAYLEKNPSDYLLKAAEMMVQSQNIEGLDDVVTQDSSLSEEATKSTEDRKKKKNTVCLRTKRKLLSTKVMDAWKPDTCKKAFVSLRRISQNELSQMTSLKSTDTLKITKTRKPPQKWTAQLDKYLKDGVKHHGQGKWSRILMDYDFEGRTGTMLKDRWRVLMRLHKVG